MDAKNIKASKLERSSRGNLQDAKSRLTSPGGSRTQRKIVETGTILFEGERFAELYLILKPFLQYIRREYGLYVPLFYPIAYKCFF